MPAPQSALFRRELTLDSSLCEAYSKESNKLKQKGSDTIIPTFPHDACWFLFQNDEMLCRAELEQDALPSTQEVEKLLPGATEILPIGTLDGKACFAASLRSVLPPAGFSFDKIRPLHSRIASSQYEFSLRAYHLLNWRLNHRYCGRCGSPFALAANELAVHCQACGNLVFPRISPAIIVAIEKDDQLLLARSNRFTTGMYSVLAGFVEPGETFEQCLKREVREEVGIAVHKLQYIASQPWPFPDSLMVGFSAQWESGDINIDGVEIVDAGWYTVDTFPLLPGKDSIARKLIDRFVAKQVNGKAC